MYEAKKVCQTALTHSSSARLITQEKLLTDTITFLFKSVYKALSDHITVSVLYNATGVDVIVQTFDTLGILDI